MNKYITIVFLLLVSMSYAQKKYAADKYFEKLAYVKSAKLYEEVYNKGNISALVISRLADSYYYNMDTEKSEYWYSKLFEEHKDKEISLEHYFRYSQSLRSNGKYKESDRWLLKLNELKVKDCRAESLSGNQDYLVKYSPSQAKYINIKSIDINTKYSDYGAFIMNDEIIFSSTRPKGDINKNTLYKWNKQPFLNVYKTSLNRNEESTKTEYFDTEKVESINTIYHEASAIVSKDGKYMYFTRDNYDGKKLKSDKKRVSHLKLYRAEKLNDVWVNITELPFNSDDYSTGQPALDNNEKHLYFTSDIPGGFGSTDIYKVEILANNQYGPIENLGGDVNTEGTEMFPNIKGTKLYFSSNGHIGLGGLDIFESDIVDNKYSKPENLKKPINSTKDDFCFSINKQNTAGYFSSNREGGKGDDDIYSFDIYDYRVFVDGIVYDLKTNKTLANTDMVLMQNDSIVNSFRTDNVGMYKIELKKGSGLYSIVAFQKTYDLAENSIVVEEKNINSNFYLGKKQYDLKPIYFDFDKHNIRPDAQKELDYIVSIMKNDTDIKIEIESHTDSRGSSAYNDILSEKRANSVFANLVNKGISKDRITSNTSYGESRLTNQCDDDSSDNCNKNQHQINRRSTFKIVR